MRTIRRFPWTTASGAAVPTLVLAAALALPGCAGRYGAARYDAGVERSFADAQVLPAHRYYTTGSDTAPDAILALREDRPLRSDLWREVTMTPELLARLTDRMQGTRTDGPGGRVLLDGRGGRIGVWYSFFAPAPPRLLDDGGVVINPPIAALDERTPAFHFWGDRKLR